MKGLLVGYGSIGRRHLTNFFDAGVTDWAVVHTGQGTLPVEPPGPVRIYPDLSVALREERPSFAVVANPTNLHVATALACVETGCPTLIEKPVSHSLDGLERLAAAERSQPIKSLVGFQFRFHPALRRIEQLLRDHTIGTPLHARAVWAEYLPDWHPWEDYRGGYAARADLGGGVHHTISHPLDYLRMLFGGVTSVMASLTVNGSLGLDVAESADIVLHFETGISAMLHLDYWGRPATHRLDITCAEGSISWDYMTGELDIWDAARQRWENESYPGLDRRNDLFVSETHHMLEVVAGKAAPVCTLQDGIEVVRVCEAIERSAARGITAELLRA